MPCGRALQKRKGKGKYYITEKGKHFIWLVVTEENKTKVIPPSRHVATVDVMSAESHIFS